MRKSFSLIASIAMIAALAAAPLNAFAEEVAVPEEATTEAVTEAATEEATEAATEPATEAATVVATEAAPAPAIDEETAIGEALTAAGKQFQHVSSEWVVGQLESYWRVGVKDASKDKAEVVYYHVNEKGAVLENAAVATTTAAATTKAATKAANKNGSPKTGDAFPALPVAGAAVAAVAVAFALRKKED